MTVNAIQQDLPASAREISGSRSPARADDKRNEAETNGGENFSFALAASSLRSQAARALETHGAVPAETKAPPRPREDRAGRHVAHEASQNRGAGEPAAAKRGANAHLSRPTTVSKSPIPSPDAAQSNLSGAVASGAAGPVAPGAAPLAISAANATRNVIDSLAARDGGLQRPSGAMIKSAAPPPDRAAASERDISADKQVEFARLLARRAVDGASDFELRLDPPHLGRITGKLSIGEEGRSIMSLTFDNQETFDLFSRDVDLLRATLADAGLSLGSGDLSFSLTNREAPDQANATATDKSGAENVSGRTVLIPEAQYLALWSSGLVDMKI